MKTSLRSRKCTLLLIIAALLPLSALAHDKLELDPTQAYHLLPEDLNAASHPSNQVGYQSEEFTTIEHRNGTWKYSAPEQEGSQGTTSNKTVISKKIEVLPDSLIRYQRSNSSEITRSFEGQEIKDETPDLLAGEALLIDMKEEKPEIRFENPEIVPSAEQAALIKELSNEYAQLKQSNPWIPDQLTYGNKPRTPGEVWTLTAKELEQLNDWLTQVRLQNQGEYQMSSVQVEFLELKEINHLPYAILEVQGEYTIQGLNIDQATKTNSQGEFKTRVSRNLITFVESATSMEGTAKFEMINQGEQGEKYEMKSQLLQKRTEKNSLPLERENQNAH